MVDWNWVQEAGMSLRMLALSAPQFDSNLAGHRALNSSDPVSLFNALRVVAQRAGSETSAWHDSNLSGDCWSRRSSIIHAESLDETLSALAETVPRLRPNLVFIGAMSICLRGAIECARFIKESLDQKVCIVLGGRHASETIYIDQDGKTIRHHPGSPLRLMEEERIEHVFDIVVSGDGEEICAEIGELVARAQKQGRDAAEVIRDLADLRDVPGTWIAGALRDGHIRCVSSRGVRSAREKWLTPSEAFGVTAKFGIFGNRWTAHAFSDIGRGCIYDCAFCSEAISVTGTPVEFSGGYRRLAHQLNVAASVIEARYGVNTASAFVDDSTLLGFSASQIQPFAREMLESGLKMPFGGQATIDQILRNPGLLRCLSDVGLNYLFVGIETFNPAEIGGISKDIGYRSGTWADRVKRVGQLLAENNIRLGVSLLFGLGESRQSRDALLEMLSALDAEYGLSTISMNWAVQHPLRGRDAGANYRYTEWAIDDPGLIGPLSHFGEASTLYCLPGLSPPGLDEVSTIIRTVDEMLHRDGADPSAGSADGTRQ
jgi:B12-binding domain/radical SAM domain protein